MENRAAVDLEFQFESHKTKAKLRESELLSALSEKDGAIDDLQHRLLELSRDVLCNSKEDLMRSICPDIETSCERICNKCTRLELLLEEHKQSTSSSNGNSAHTIDCECEQLRMEIANTRTKLESVQQAYKQMTSDVAEKSELCDRLNRDFVAAEEAKGALQQKCDNYEQTIQSMQGMYEDIQKKYVQLQQDYERLEDMQQKYVQLQQDYELLEANREKFEKIQQDYENLESQNERLQQEISTLKASMEQLQERLIAGTVAEDREQQTIALVQEMRTRNEKLMADIVELETRFNAIQLEYDDMSNQLMESVQDGDNLRKQCNALQQQLQQQEKTDKVQELLAHIAQLESEVAEKNMLIDATEGTINNLREQMTNLESALLEKSVIVNKVEDYQRQIESLEKQHAEMTMVCEELQEKVKENTINESDGSQLNLMFNQTEDPAAEVVLFKEHLSELKAEVNQLQTQLRQKDELIDRMQAELQELNERCMNMDVQQVELQANARENQQLLERQAAKLSDDAERIDKLQESNAQLLERSIKAEERLEQAAEEGKCEIEKLNHEMKKSQTEFELKKQQHKEQLESIREEYEKRLNEMQIELEKSQKEFEIVEKELKTSSEEYEKRLEDMKTSLELAKKEHRDGLDNLKLDYLQKIEASEMNFRQNLRKYNIEWEEGKATYEASIERLAKQLTQRTEYTEKLCRESETKLLAIKAANDKAVEQLVKEKHELESMYDDSQKLLKQLQNQQQKDDSELQAMYEQQKRDYEQLKTECNLSLDTLKQEKSSLQFEVDECKLLIERLNNEQEQLNSKLALAQKEEANYLERVETLNSKIDDLVKDVKEADLKAKDFDQLVSEHKETKCLLTAANELTKNLTDEVNNLKRDLLLAQTKATNVEKLQAELEEALLLKSNACAESENLSEKLKELEANVVEKSNRFEQNIKELQSCKNELQLKLDTVETQKMELENQKLELENANHQQTVKLKNELNLQDLNAKLQQTNEELLTKIDSNEKSLQHLKQTNTQLENRLAEAEKNSSEEAKKLEKLQIEIDKLRSVMKTTKINFESERKRMDGTISSLLEDKRNLEEKLCTAEEILKKLEADLRSKANGSNISFDSNASSNSSPAPRKSLEREHNQPRKSLGVESELRKNRRMSTHDERRQSYWNDSRHVACMTDPVDNSCNCEVLDRKLKDSQRDLFIMESRVTALSIELKNHPLKEETAILKKRLQEEQAKARDEIKKLKQKNTELMSKMNVQAASAAISVSSSQAMPQLQLATVQTQTECDAFKKMSDKLNDCLQLCRHRYTKIKELEDRLKQNENADTSNISSQTAGQINALKSQLEAQKKDNLSLKNKYEFAKRALKLRKDELEEMRKVAGIDPTDQ